MSTKTSHPLATAKRLAAVSVDVPTVHAEDDLMGPIMNGVMVIRFADGDTIRVTGQELGAHIIAQAFFHGLKQKLVDAAAISRDPETGRSATAATKKAAVKEVLDRLKAGEWNKRREGGEGTGTGGLLFRALCRLYPNKEPESIKEFLASKDTKAQAALRANPKIAAIIDQLRAEASNIDSDSLLGELEGEVESEVED